MNFLKGKFFVNDCGSFYRKGEIVEATDEYVLLKFFNNKDQHDMTRPSHIISLNEIANTIIEEVNRYPAWSFFDTKESMEGFVRFMDAPTENEEDKDAVVVPIRGH